VRARAHGCGRSAGTQTLHARARSNARTPGRGAHRGYSQAGSAQFRMCRQSCLATVHDCPYWQRPSGAWHLAQWRRNSSHRCCLATYSFRCCCCCAAAWLARSMSGSIGPGPSPARRAGGWPLTLPHPMSPHILQCMDVSTRAPGSQRRRRACASLRFWVALPRCSVAPAAAPSRHTSLAAVTGSQVRMLRALVPHGRERSEPAAAAQAGAHPNIGRCEKCAGSGRRAPPSGVQTGLTTVRDASDHS